MYNNHNNNRFLFSRKEEKTDSMMHQLTSMLYVVLCSGNRCNCIVRNRPTALRAGSAARQQVGEILFGRIRVHCLLHRHESCQCRFQALSLLLQRLGRRMSYLIITFITEATFSLFFLSVTYLWWRRSKLHDRRRVLSRRNRNVLFALLLLFRGRRSTG